MTAPAIPGQPLIGHDWAIDLLRRGLTTGRAPHAYLVTGLPHLGKFTTALAMARELLCPQDPACGVCRHCDLAGRLAHPDLRILEIPPERRNIPIQDVHEMLHGMALKPLEAPRKVYVIRGAEDLADEGANALLKTLEEPPARVVLILTAPSAARILPTMVSRCQLIALHPVPESVIAEALVTFRHVDPAQATIVAKASRGRPGWAVNALTQKGLLDERREQAAALLSALRGDRLDRIRLADKVAERWSAHQDEVRDTVEGWIELWRDFMLAQQHLASRITNLELADEINDVARQVSAAAITEAMGAAMRTAEALDSNVSPRLCLENLLLHLPRLQR